MSKKQTLYKPPYQLSDLKNLGDVRIPIQELVVGRRYMVHLYNNPNPIRGIFIKRESWHGATDLLYFKHTEGDNKTKTYDVRLVEYITQKDVGFKDDYLNNYVNDFVAGRRTSRKTRRKRPRR